MKEKWSVEYSTIQGSFHVDSLEHALSKNLASVVGGHQTQYCMIGVFDTREECSAFIEKLVAAKSMPNYSVKLSEEACTLE